MEGFFRPFFGVVFQDRSPRGRPRLLPFLMSMLGRGSSVIPSDGLGMIAEWTSAAVRQAGGIVELGVRVEGLEPDTAGRRIAAVRTADGRRLAARHVVLAVDAPAAPAAPGAARPGRGGAAAHRAGVVRHGGVRAVARRSTGGGRSS